MRVLLDGRVAGYDGIGRYTRCLAKALSRIAEARADLSISVLGPTGTPRYSRAEGEELVVAARGAEADLIHTLDFRIPLTEIPCPLVVSIHDILRLVLPDHCYSDEAFAARFGAEGSAELRAVTGCLRALRPDPRPVRSRPPRSVHEEYYGRMLALAVHRAAAVITPTQTVSELLRSWVSPAARLTVSPYGVDHNTEPNETPADIADVPDAPFMLHVGQARPHKGIDVLACGYARSRARSAGVRLVCVGSDFIAGGPGSRPFEDAGVLRDTLLLGQVSDSQLSALYRCARVLVHLPEHEGFGFTPVEAMAHATRVVASDIPVLRETLGPHAVFVPRDDPEAIARAMDEAALTGDAAEEAELRRAWVSRYSWERHALDIMDTYGRVLST